MKNRQIVQTRIGKPAEAVDTVFEEVPVPGDDELLVELVLAPINPAELLMLEGRYGHGDTVPPVPRHAGIEGVGRVVGGATDRVPEGSYVSLAGLAPVFADYRVVKADQVLVLPEGIDLEVVALALVNAQAVLMMLELSPELEAGDVVIQNAGNSAYGRILDAVVTRKGLRVVNVVRSEEAAASIAGAAGAVVIDGDDLASRVLAATGGITPRLAVDAVGGDATGRIATTLAPGGRVLAYGLMSGEPSRIDIGLVVFGGISLEGFWFPRAAPQIGATRMAEIAHEAFEVIRDGGIEMPIEARYGLDDIGAALEHAGRESRSGKIVVTR